jgi:heme-degrading monooxygenase HmoA
MGIRAEADWVRLTYLKIQPEKVEELKKIYHEAIIPTVKAQWGNVDVFLLEPVEEEDEYLSFTVWDSQADAEIYETSGVYGEQLDKIKHTFAGPTVLKAYEITS